MALGVTALTVRLPYSDNPSCAPLLGSYSLSKIDDGTEEGDGGGDGPCARAGTAKGPAAAASASATRCTGTGDGSGSGGAAAVAFSPRGLVDCSSATLRGNEGALAGAEVCERPTTKGSRKVQGEDRSYNRGQFDHLEKRASQSHNPRAVDPILLPVSQFLPNNIFSLHNILSLKFHNFLKFLKFLNPSPCPRMPHLLDRFPASGRHSSSQSKSVPQSTA
ncbi:hypothetical protein VOLCADRAFT_95872 [Volvox carteri f. nagariensis]|uniref:Uncharacterized protein n=1 Tax=Volvox carteri f. nagariensis TaxID=3068 RepID=D8U8L5_VOLCA|nr:uncharacterized protein VOLCADRAFT_95872 [Volvox carteri f. nagariensis]EFJ44003.1 hypothetical protein VOLCADRAFT_95872 [Volvox carteri f. nagariensis]|eukprot:XP_002955015.1 hypothetical protein VOLCADRAFT_95872 [Volvox carteri f. nagariensis]